MGAQDSDDDFDEESLDVMAGKRHQEAEDCFDAMAKVSCCCTLQCPQLG